MVTWNNIKIADKGFLINLEERKDRLEESLLEFEKNNIVGVDRFDAIKITENNDYGWVIRGCTHSHMDILKLQVQNKWDKIIIFEDDFFLDVCHKNNEPISDNIIKKIYDTDFDLYFLGSCLMETAEKVNDYLIKPKGLVQTTTYLSSLKFANYVIDNFNYLDKELVVYGEQIDTYYSVLSTKQHWLMESREKGVKEIKDHDLKIYFNYPILFNQRASFSNITNNKTNYVLSNRFRNLKYYPETI